MTCRTWPQLADELQPRAFVLPATPQHSGSVIKAAQVAAVCGINCVSADSDSDYSDGEADMHADMIQWLHSTREAMMQCSRLTCRRYRIKTASASR